MQKCKPDRQGLSGSVRDAFNPLVRDEHRPYGRHSEEQLRYDQQDGPGHDRRAQVRVDAIGGSVPPGVSPTFFLLHAGISLLRAC